MKSKTFSQEEIFDCQDETFERCPHDRKNPYSMVSNELIMDQNISPNCRWLLIYFLRNKEGWKINIKQVINHCKPHFGRDKVYKLVNEAIEAGYIDRVSITVTHITPKGRKFKGLKRYKYKVSETPKFKKSFLYPENKDTGGSDSGNTDDNKDYSIVSSKEEPILKKDYKSDPAIGRLTSYFLNQLRKINPKVRDPNIRAWEKQMSALMKTDGRTEAEVTEVIDFIISQHNVHYGTTSFCWSSAVQSPEKLRKHFATIWLQLKKPPAAQKELDPLNFSDNRILAERIWNKFKGRTDIHLGSNYLEFTNGTNAKSDFLQFGTVNFRNNCLQALKKRKLSTEGL